VRRHRSISIAYTDARGSRREWNRLDQATSELLQHELDHLDGVLAIDNALDRDSIISRAAFEAYPELFRARVDYVIASD
ncbi:MAG: peptide deformylase, partial [Armatimonadota bacterium]